MGKTDGLSYPPRGLSRDEVTIDEGAVKLVGDKPDGEQAEEGLSGRSVSCRHTAWLCSDTS